MGADEGFGEVFRWLPRDFGGVGRGWINPHPLSVPLVVGQLFSVCHDSLSRTLDRTVTRLGVGG